jgi:succinoglycan biosynthesis protein ExoM
MSRVVIGIPTFRRPESLRRLLRSIADLEPIDAEVVVVVADNDPAAQDGLAIASEVAAAGYRYELTAFLVESAGLAAVRNALMQRAFRDFDATKLAMVDDDERVEAGWLAGLERAQQAFDADLIFGAIRPEFERTPPAWVVGQPMYWGNVYPHGRAADAPGTGSVLLRRRVFDGLGLRFDETYSFSGGEDRDFFMRLRALGGSFAHASDAVSYEYVGEDRMKRGWVLQRAFRIGATDARIGKRFRRSTIHRILELAKIPVALLVGVLGVVLACVDSRRQMRFAVLVCRQAGKVAGLLGWLPKTYAAAATGGPHA